jgi:hypothetical protein
MTKSFRLTELGGIQYAPENPFSGKIGLAFRHEG